MKKVELTKNKVNLNNYIKKVASEKDCANIIDYDCLIYIDGIPKVAYLTIPNELTKYVRQSCLNVKLNHVERLSDGLITSGKNRVFGYRPARQMSQFASTCSTAGMAKDFPLEHSALCSFSKVAKEYYEKIFPTQYSNNLKVVEEKILKEWTLEDTVFTSGIINKDSVLQYHFDIGHVSKALSVMLTLKKELKGGNLSIPEIDTLLKLNDNTLLIFDGQELLHGVTPIVKKSEKSYRFTIVYYSLIQMWKCLTIDEEIIKARKKRFQKEHKRASNQVGEMASDTLKNGKRFSVEKQIKEANK
jgi:hypothetical protein